MAATGKDTFQADNLERPHHQVWAIAFPAILANSAAPIVGLVDTWAVGHLPGAVHLAAVGLGSVIFSYIFWAFGFLRMSTTGLVAQARGRGDDEGVAANAIRAGALALVFGALLILLQEVVLALAQDLLEAPAGAAAITAEYFHIRIWAAPAMLLVYAITGVLFGLARMRAVLLLQLVLNITNGVLNVTFVVGLDMGVPGVALGTLIAQWLSVAVGGVALARAVGRDVLLGALKARATWRLEPVRHLMSTNGYIFVRTIFLMTALAMIMRAAARLGEVEMAASHVLTQYMLLMSLGLDGFAHAAEALVGAAFGHGRRDVFRRWVYFTSLWAVAASLAYALLFWLGGNVITALLTDLSGVRALVAEVMPLVIALPVVAVWCYQFDGIYIAATAGRAMMVTMAAAFAVYLAVLPPLTVEWGLNGLWGAVLIFMGARGLTQALWMPWLERGMALPTPISN